MTTKSFETPVWLTEQSKWTRPTEILLPLEEGIGPVWMYNPDRGGWYAFLHVQPFPEYLFECDHCHPTKDEAWECAHEAAIIFVAEKLGGNDS